MNRAMGVMYRCRNLRLTGHVTLCTNKGNARRAVYSTPLSYCDPRSFHFSTHISMSLWHDFPYSYHDGLCKEDSCCSKSYQLLVIPPVANWGPGINSMNDPTCERSSMGIKTRWTSKAMIPQLVTLVILDVHRRPHPQ
ncbi:hypothetical protein BYT27DRAFT_6380691 [Phlegmacium glaucopus]|nr:hypothetical protein BYT27DRAFT_6380691 [Phlegmacium glaucopus]